MSAGLYQVRVGDVFYVGSTTNFKRRKSRHLSSLCWGEHPSKRLQEEFLKLKTAEFQPLEYLHKEEGETVEQFRNRLRSAEQAKLDELSADPLFAANMANVSRNAFGPDNGKIMAEKWKEPEFRARMIAMLKARKGDKVSKETRELMAKAKTGANNTQSRKVVVTHPNGATSTFDCASDAAAFFKVKQQILFYWMTLGSWPGTGTRPCRAKYKWISEYRAAFVTDS